MKYIIISTIFIASVAHAAVENLDEVVARKSRLASSTWSPLTLEDGTTKVWNPESLSYTDIATGSEVWRVTYSKSGQGGRSQDIASSSFSANGDRLLFISNRESNAFPYANGINPIFMISKTDGSMLRPALGASARLATVDPYSTWSTVIPDVFYKGAANDGQPLSSRVLYKNTVTDTSITASALLTLPAPVNFIKLKKSLSGDGRKLWIKDYSSNTFYPATVYPEASKGFDTTNGYSGAFNFDGYWGGTVTWNGLHDQYTAGAVNGIDGVWNILMPETSASDGPFWRARLQGSGTNQAPTHTQDRTYPYAWGEEIEPVNTVTDFANKPSPWCADGSATPDGAFCVDSSGHGAPDRWGRYLIGADPNDGHGYGLGFLDMRTHIYVTPFKNLASISHPDWEAWSDWSIASGTATFSDPTSGPSNPQVITTAKLGSIGSQRNILSTHPRYNNTGGAPYEANARPTQSPDGTKALFNATFLNASDSDVNLYWGVASYPYPPQIQSAAINTGKVRITWDFNQGTGCAATASSADRSGPTPNFSTSRTYATRGWPHETSDCPPSPREIDKFRVWTSPDNSTWTPVNTVNYNNCRAGSTNECGMWGESSWHFDATQLANTTRYYSITSVEYSGLESRSLGNVWKVITDGSGNITTQSQQVSYPSSPGAKNNFSASYNASLTRYYNIYAKDVSTPDISQQTRIASIPVSSAKSYIDWLGNSNGTTKYTVTAVDTQGNESNALTASFAGNGIPGHYLITWKDSMPATVPIIFNIK